MGLMTKFTMFYNMFSPRWLRQFFLGIADHWIKIVVFFVVVVTTGLSWFFMRKLDPFYQNMMLAQMPLWMLVMLIGSCISAFIYVSMMFGLFGRMGSKRVQGEFVQVTFKDVIGIDEAKEEAWEVVQLLKDHTKVKAVGGKVIKGLLMQGPPGCGKTYLAKAIASEAGIPFLSMAASDFTQMFVGVGASRVRKSFKNARRLAYSHGACIIFIDELDAVGRTRSFSFGGGQETNNTLNSLLVEMDGLQGAQENVVVIGASNADESTLDEALLRPGRFDRKIYVDRPNLEGREKVFEYYLSKVKYESSIDKQQLARWSVYKSPAEIENIVKEAALIAIRDKRDEITYKDLSQSMERIDLGIKHRKTMTKEERRATAFHEAGHLVVTYLLHPTDDVFKASIVARRASLGVVMPRPRQELHTDTRDRMLANIKVSLAGYVAEKVTLGYTTNGVSSDFRKAFAIARMMICQLGMGSKYVGDWTGFPGQTGMEWAWALSESTKSELDEETNNLLKSCEKEVEELFNKERKILDRFADELLKREELEYDDIEKIFSEYGKSSALDIAEKEKGK